MTSTRRPEDRVGTCDMGSNDVSHTFDEEQPGWLTGALEGAQVRDVGGIGRGEHQVRRVRVTTRLQLDLPQVIGQRLARAGPAKVDLVNID